MNQQQILKIFCQEVGVLDDTVAVPVAGGRVVGGGRPAADALPRAATPNACGIEEDEEEEEMNGDEEEMEHAPRSHGESVRSSTFAARTIRNLAVTQPEAGLSRSIRNQRNV